VGAVDLKRSSLKLLRDVDPRVRNYEWTAIDSVYHECTHSYLFRKLKSSDAQVTGLVTRAEAYYKDAPMKNGTKSKDPARLCHEAAAEYVAHRASAWWQTYEQLHLCLSSFGNVKHNPRFTYGIFKKLITKYDKAMARGLHGYEEQGSDEVYTKRKIMPELKRYCDRVLLEGKLPYRFSNDQRLVKVWRQAYRMFQIRMARGGLMRWITTPPRPRKPTQRSRRTRH
jgi:hypothetical protein